MRVRALLVTIGVLAGLVGIVPPVAGQTTNMQCVKDPQGDEMSGFERTDYDPVDIVRACYRYSAEALTLDISVVKPLDPLKAAPWEDGFYYMEVYPHDADAPTQDSPIEIMYYVSGGEIVVRARPIAFAQGEDWECFGSGTTTATGYAAKLPWECIRLEDQLRFTYRIILNRQQYAHNDVHNDGICCGPPPPKPSNKPAVTIRNADSACPPDRVPEDGMQDAEGNIHEAAIDCVMWWGVATRTSAGRFSPSAVVTRGLMAEWIARFLDRTGGQLPEHAEDQFSDVASSPYRASINRIAAAEVVGGYPDGTFRPTQPVTRAQMATFIASAHRFASGQVLGTTTTDWFSDDESSVHEEAINRIASVGVAGGTARGAYSPEANIKRDQMASFLARLLDVAVDEGRAAPPA